MKKKSQIKVWVGKSDRISETLSEWSKVGVKFYIKWYGHFYGFQNKKDGESFIPEIFDNPRGRKHISEQKKNNVWFVKPIPNSFNEFCLTHFAILEERLNGIDQFFNKLDYEKKRLLEFFNNDEERLYYYFGIRESIQEGDLVSFIPENEEVEITYRISSIIKRLTNDDNGDESEINYKIMIQPYFEGTRTVLVEKINN